MVKSGWKTTEFWATIAVDAAAVISAIAGNLPSKWAAIAGTVTTALYTLSRGLAKHGAAATSSSELTGS